MFDKNQLVKMTWQRTNRRIYEPKGYVFTKIGDKFEVMAKDLACNSKARIKVVCDYCGKEYDASFINVMKSRKTIEKDACFRCKYKKSSEVSIFRNAHDIICRAKNACEKAGYGLLTTEQEYTGVKMTARIECPKHGEQNVNLWALLNGAGCPSCARETVAIKNTLDADYVEEYINGINGNTLLNKEDYKTRKTHNLNIRCTCGNVYTTSFECYIAGVQQCYSCSCKESKREREIRLFLDAHNINFEQEKRFDDCHDINILPFDFYLPEYNLIIEFDGQHHFEETHNRADYETTKRHDAIKNKYCEDNNINLLRIPYWDGNKIEKILTKELNL